MRFDDEGHVCISPAEVRQLAFDDPDALIDRWLMPGTPWAFGTYADYNHFVEYLSSHTGIHPHHFLFRGSTKIGFSISPSQKEKKVWRSCGPMSDLDLAITDPHFFAMVDEEVRRYDRRPENLEKCLRWKTGRVVEKYRNRVEQKGRHDCYRYFDLPNDLACVQELYEVMSNAPIQSHCVYSFFDFKAFIFRDRWAVHRRYHTDLDDLRRGLTTRYDPLPKPPKEPFSSQEVQ